MTRQLDREAVNANIRALKSCFDEFLGCKLLITSRTHFFSNRRDKQRLLNWLGNPLVMQLAPLSRKTVDDYLKNVASRSSANKTLSSLRNMHDPIGLGTKPLFLQMLKETLGDLPQALDVVTLYETYVRKILGRKIEFLERDECFLHLPDELISNLEHILEQIALELQVSQKDYVSLRDTKGHRPWAELLWKSTDPDFFVRRSVNNSESVEANATAQVGVRSLLTRVTTHDMDEEWTVDFCHRSVREYFVARAFVLAIRDDVERAKCLLKHTPLNHEILDFIVALLNRDTRFDGRVRILELLSAAIPTQEPGYLGGHLLTLLYRMTGSVPGPDWRGRVLDFADLTAADLSNKDFTNSSLRYANLDNANFEQSNFSNCDLTGVRIEETSFVESLAVISEDRFLVAYADGSIREWDISHPQRASSRIVLFSRTDAAVRLGVQPTGELWALGNNTISFFDWKQDKTMCQVACFQIRTDLRDINLGDTDVTALIDAPAMCSRPIVVAYGETSARLCGPVSPAIMCAGLNGIGFVIYSGSQGLSFLYPEDGSGWRSLRLDSERVTCISAWALAANSFLVGSGLESGKVRVSRLTSDGEKWRVDPLLDYAAHRGYISSIAFLNEERIITGGQDRCILVTEFSEEGKIGYPRSERKLALAIRCKGMKIKGLRGPREYELLRNLIGN